MTHPLDRAFTRNAERDLYDDVVRERDALAEYARLAFAAGVKAGADLVDEEAHSAYRFGLFREQERLEVLAESIRNFANDPEWVKGASADAAKSHTGRIAVASEAGAAANPPEFPRPESDFTGEPTPNPSNAQNCSHESVKVTFDEEAAKNLTAFEVRQRWPRFHGNCPDCGAQLIKYASQTHYYSGDW